MRSRIVVAARTVALLAMSTAAAQQPPVPRPAPPDAPTEAVQDSLTAGELADAISAYIEDDADLKGGTFTLYDDIDKKALALTLVKVHDDRLASTGDNVYFACSDMKSADGTLYDIDFFMTRDEDDELQTVEIAIHQKAGKPRYAWREEHGIWKRGKP